MCQNEHYIFTQMSTHIHSGPENLKKSRQKNSWNKKNPWNCIFGSFKLFPSSKIDFWPFLKSQKMEFGQKKIFVKLIYLISRVFWPGLFWIFWPTMRYLNIQQCSTYNDGVPSNFASHCGYPKLFCIPLYISIFFFSFQFLNVAIRLPPNQMISVASTSCSVVAKTKSVYNWRQIKIWVNANVNKVSINKTMG